jgi:hypothetical protein
MTLKGVGYRITWLSLFQECRGAELAAFKEARPQDDDA